MSGRFRLLVVAIVTLAILPAAPSMAAGGHGPVRSLLGIVLPPVHGNPRSISVVRPWTSGYHPYDVGGPETYGYGGVPTYNWGFFGARHRPGASTHTDYYGDYFQRTLRPGY